MLKIAGALAAAACCRCLRACCYVAISERSAMFAD